MSDRPKTSRPTRSERLPEEILPIEPSSASSPFAPIGAVDLPVAIDPDDIQEGAERISQRRYNEDTAGQWVDGDHPIDSSNETSTEDEDTADKEGTITVDGSQDSGDPGSTGTGEPDESSGDEDLTVGSHDTPNDDLGSDPVIDPPSREPGEDEVVGPENPRIEPPNDGDDPLNRAPIVDYEERHPELETIDDDGPDVPGPDVDFLRGEVDPSDDRPSDGNSDGGKNWEPDLSGVDPDAVPDYASARDRLVGTEDPPIEIGPYEPERQDPPFAELTGVEDQVRRPELEIVGSADSDEDEAFLDDLG